MSICWQTYHRHFVKAYKQCSSVIIVKCFKYIAYHFESDSLWHIFIHLCVNFLHCWEIHTKYCRTTSYWKVTLLPLVLIYIKQLIESIYTSKMMFNFFFFRSGWSRNLGLSVTSVRTSRGSSMSRSTWPRRLRTELPNTRNPGKSMTSWRITGNTYILPYG